MDHDVFAGEVEVSAELGTAEPSQTAAALRSIPPSANGAGMAPCNSSTPSPQRLNQMAHFRHKPVGDTRVCVFNRFDSPSLQQTSMPAFAPRAHHPFSIGGAITAMVGQRVMLTDEGKRTFDEIWLNVSGNSFGTITKVLQNGSACTVVWDDDPRRQAHTYRTGGLHRFELALVSAHADAEISPNPTQAPPDPVAAIRSSWARTGHDEKEVWKDAGDERVHISHDTDTSASEHIKPLEGPATKSPPATPPPDLPHEKPASSPLSRAILPAAPPPAPAGPAESPLTKPSTTWSAHGTADNSSPSTVTVPSGAVSAGEMSMPHLSNVASIDLKASGPQKALARADRIRRMLDKIHAKTADLDKFSSSAILSVLPAHGLGDGGSAAAEASPAQTGTTGLSHTVPVVTFDDEDMVAAVANRREPDVGGRPPGAVMQDDAVTRSLRAQGILPPGEAVQVRVGTTARLRRIYARNSGGDFCSSTLRASPPASLHPVSPQVSPNCLKEGRQEYGRLAPQRESPPAGSQGPASSARAPPVQRVHARTAFDTFEVSWAAAAEAGVDVNPVFLSQSAHKSRVRSDGWA